MNCDCSRVFIYDLKSSYRCPYGFEYENDVSIGVKISWYLLAYEYIICNLNVNGLNADAKRKTIFNYLKQKKFEIILLQETHSTVKVEKLREME